MRVGTVSIDYGCAPLKPALFPLLLLSLSAHADLQWEAGASLASEQVLRGVSVAPDTVSPGLDLSLRGSGIATVTVAAGAELDGDGRTGAVGYPSVGDGKSGPENRSQPVSVDTRTIVSSGRKGAPLPSRIARIRRLRNTICDHARHADPSA